MIAPPARIGLRSVSIQRSRPGPPKPAGSLTTSTDRWTFKWSLIVTADVVRGRNTRRERKVDVLLAESANP